MTAVVPQSEKIIPDIVKKEELKTEEQETFTYYSEDSSDEYDYKDVIIHDTNEKVEAKGSIIAIHTFFNIFLVSKSLFI